MDASALLVATAIGAGVTAVGLALVQARALLHWTRTRGEVIEHMERVSETTEGRTSRTWSLVIRYAEPSGRAHLLAESSSSSHPLPVGSRVAVAYDPARPERATRVSLGASLGGPLVAALVAAGAVYALWARAGSS